VVLNARSATGKTGNISRITSQTTGLKTQFLHGFSRHGHAVLILPLFSST